MAKLAGSPSSDRSRSVAEMSDKQINAKQELPGKKIDLKTYMKRNSQGQNSQSPAKASQTASSGSKSFLELMREKREAEKGKNLKKPDESTAHLVKSTPKHSQAVATSPLKSAIPSNSSKPVSLFSDEAAAFEFMEPMEPSSSAWSKPVNYEAIKGESYRSPSRTVLDPPQNPKISRPQSLWGSSPERREYRAPPSKPSTNYATTSRQGVYEGFMSEAKAAKAISDMFSGAVGRSQVNEYALDGKVEGLNVTLLPHQISGLNFLIRREDGSIESGKGGLLCDDMGLGKTVQSIALILSNPPNKSHFDTADGEKAKCKATLVIAPVSLMHQWAGEINNKAPGLKVLVHHGPKRTKDSKSFDNYDVVITSLNLVGQENGEQGPLFHKNWWRIFIDEAHSIKNSKANMSRGSYALESDRRWCLTGTPIQNSASDLQSLFQFLRILPFSSEETFKKQITNAIVRGQGAAAMKRLQVVLDMVMLRRTKNVLQGNGIKLPARTIHRTYVKFDKKEEEIYKNLERKSRDLYFASLRGEKNYEGNALTLLLRLRQACDHTSLIGASLDIEEKTTVREGIELSPEGKTDSDGPDDLADLLQGLSVSSSQQLDVDGSSSKVRQTLEILSKEPNRKTIIFSQFTSMLSILGTFLEKNNISYVNYQGSMSADARNLSLKRLREEPKIQVLLCSLKCGALGLNLTCASQVILFDPWWNPMVSEQAIDRVHRLGQTRDVDVHELIVKDTVEERVVSLQEKKRALARGIVEGGSDDKAKMNLTQDDLKALFNASDVN